MKYVSIICLALLIVWVLVAIVDMWLDLISWAMFVKLTITLGLLMVVALAVALAKREYAQEQRSRKDQHLD